MVLAQVISNARQLQEATRSHSSVRNCWAADQAPLSAAASSCALPCLP